MHLFNPILRLLLLLTLQISHANCQNKTAPKTYGVLLFPGFSVLDVFGPLEALNGLAMLTHLNLSIIAETLAPVPSTNTPAFGPFDSTFSESVVPTHTFATAPPVDVLLIPGGFGTRRELNSTINFVRDRFPTLKYLITVCTGAGIAARAGVLDGKYATTNKRAWIATTALGPKTKWVAKARWVVDENIWSASGLSAGLDLIMAFIGEVYGNGTVKTISETMEYTRVEDWRDDPFAGVWNASDVNVPVGGAPVVR
ncbi:class I glutamine amidotransferase-like protein [Halenospora varia]|nr:class I glutamine amidotransferase-like protein [Halenospora varia]